MDDLSYLTTLLITLLSLMLIFLTWFYYESFQYWKRQGIPYVKPIIPPFGNTLKLYQGKETFGEVFANAYLDLKKKGERHGGMYYLHTPFYIPVDPNIIKKILISDAHYFINHGLYSNPGNDILSGHIFNMDDKSWKTLRTLIPPVFTSAKMRNMYLIMEKMVDPFRMWLEKYAATQEPIEIKSVLTRFTIDVLSSCAFGIDTNTLKTENDDILHHTRQFFDYQWSLFTNTIVFAVPKPILQACKFRVFSKSTEKYVVDLFTNIYKHRKENGINRDDLMNTFMRLTEGNEDLKDFTGKNKIDPIDLNQFACHMFTFLCAGYESTASTQAFALYELAKNPDCQTKLRNEIKRVLAIHDNKMTYDAIMEMKYLDRCIDETLRIYPVLPLVVRQCKEDYEVLDTGFTLKKGTPVMVTNMGIQRDPEYYPNPLQFDPERWTYENSLNRPPVANLPFGDGPRVCVAKRFGLLQTKVGIAALIKDYEVCLSDKTREGFKFVSTELVLRKEGDVWLNLKKVPK